MASMQTTAVPGSSMFGAGSMPQDVLELAAGLLDRSLQADRNYTDLSDQLLIPKHCMYYIL